MIEFRTKLQSSTRIRCWISNRTKIDDQILDSIRQRLFDLYPLIALAYCQPAVELAVFVFFTSIVFPHLIFRSTSFLGCD